MNVCLLHLDGKVPNLALMNIAAFHRDKGDNVELRWATTIAKIQPRFWDMVDRVYASTIFERTRPVAEHLLRIRPDAIIGGTGWDIAKTLALIGIPELKPDYSVYPKYMHSIGFTQRGCRLHCSFCVVPRKEGRVQAMASIWDIWRGEPYPRDVLLLDNDFFGQPEWQKRIEEMKSGGFKVSFNQGFNVRLIQDEHAAAIAEVDYRDDQFKSKRLYTAWDNRRDEELLFRNLGSLVRYGIKPDHIMVYMLIGYDHRAKSALPELREDDFHRLVKLREFGCRPYPMPYCRPAALVGFQRWVIGSYDKRISWKEWEQANYRPEKLENRNRPLFDFIDRDEP